LESSDGFVDSLNFFFAEVLDISIFSLDNSVGVDVGFLNSNNSLSAMASLEAVSFILFSTFVKAFSVATEFGSNLLGSSSEIGSHGLNSNLVLVLSNLKLFTSSLEKSFVGVLEVSNIGVVFSGKSFLLSCWKFSEIGGTSGFVFNALNHKLMLNFIVLSIENILVNALGGNFFIAFSGNGELLEENDVIFSNWFVVFSEDDVFSNFV